MKLVSNRDLQQIEQGMIRAIHDLHVDQLQAANHNLALRLTALLRLEGGS